MVVRPNPNLLLLVQLISRLADTFGLFLISRNAVGNTLDIGYMVRGGTGQKLTI